MAAEPPSAVSLDSAAPSGVDREADGWRYLPELPAESAMVLVASSSWPQPVLCMHRGGRFLMEVGHEAPGPYAWMLSPPLPEAKP